MAAAITDKLTNVSNGTRPVPTTLNAILASGASPGTANCAALTGWATNTAIHFCIYTIDANGKKIAGSQTDWKGIVSGATITGLVLKAGTNTGYSIGAIVEASPTAAWADDLIGALQAQHTQLGAHTGVTTDTLTASGVINASAVSSLQDASIPLSTIRAEVAFDYFASGGVWSGDAYASTRNGSMTALVCYINGQRGAITLVSARSFTASKDTYVDVLNTAGVFTLVYTEVANNAASPALAANSLRLAIIVTGASNIASAGSVNQGQETIVLPIASSVPYAVTDSLGNLIAPRDPNRKLLGFRQRVSGIFSTVSTTFVQITELSCPVIVPVGRKVKVTITGQDQYNSGAGVVNVGLSIWDGVVGSGTQLQANVVQQPAASMAVPAYVDALTTPTTSSKTYNGGLKTNSAANAANLDAASTSPLSIRVELE